MTKVIANTKSNNGVVIISGPDGQYPGWIEYKDCANDVFWIGPDNENVGRFVVQDHNDFVLADGFDDSDKAAEYLKLHLAAKPVAVRSKKSAPVVKANKSLDLSVLIDGYREGHTPAYRSTQDGKFVVQYAKGRRPMAYRLFPTAKAANAEAKRLIDGMTTKAARSSVVVQIAKIHPAKTVKANGNKNMRTNHTVVTTIHADKNNG